MQLYIELYSPDLASLIVESLVLLSKYKMTINFKKGNMKEERKAKYVTPQIEIIEMESEGVMALSNMPGGNPGMTGGRSSRRSTQRYSSSSISELEDLINDILTFEK